MKLNAKDIGRTQLAVSALVSSAVALGALVTLRWSADRDRWVKHTHEVIVAIERTISLVRSVENDHLNRLMTGDLGERGVYDSSVAALDAQLAALAALTVDNRRHQASIFQLRRLVSVQQADYREQIAILTRQGSEAAIARARVDRDKAVLPTVLATAEDMARVENTLRDQQLEAARRGERLTMVLTVAGWVINLAILTSRLRCT